MKRNVEAKINEWYKSGSKALLIEGARQVGKTYSIRKVLNENETSFFEINFINRPDILKSLQTTDDVKLFVEKLCLYSPTKLEKHKTIIFFDEIQCFPEIVTKIKFLVDEGSFRYILSGSLLGIELKSIKSVPVGYLEIIKMYPMSFYEFLFALGTNSDLIEYINNCFVDNKEIDEVIHNSMLSLFNSYLIVGGMPSVVKIFIETKNLLKVDKEQKNIIELYRSDFIKYEREEKKLKIIDIYDNIPNQLLKQNTKFVFTYLNGELKFDRYENSFLWLKDAGVSLPVYNVTDVKSPLIMSKEKNNFKLFLSDVGLLSSVYPFEVRQQMLTNSLNEYNNGPLYENFVCQELCANNLLPYYFKSSKIGEVDFLVEINNKICAIEVKSGSGYLKHNALNHFINENANVNPYVFCNSNILTKDLSYYPIYLIGLLKNDEPHDFIIDINIPTINK